MQKQPVEERKVFNLRYASNLCFCENRQMTLNEAQEIYKALGNTIDFMRQGNSNKQIKQIARIRLYNTIMEDAKWFFHEKAHHFAYEPYKKFQGASGNCVYFLYVPHNNWMKIGSTYDLYNRTKVYHQEQRDYRGYQVVAYIYSELHYRQLEKLLHIQFSDHRIFTEVFQPEPILSWLEQQEKEALNG